MGLYLVSFRHAYGLVRFTSLIFRTQICPSKLNINMTLEKPPQQQLPLWAPSPGASCKGSPRFSGDSIIQQHESPFLPNAVLMTAAAQPTPGLTLMADAGQFMEQAPHSMHASRFRITAVPLFRANTAWGQTRRHIPHPTHLSGSMPSETTSFR